MGKDYETVGFRYGLLAPSVWDAECEREMRLMNDLWNKLVEIDRAFAVRYRAVRSGFPELAAAEERLKAIVEEMDELKSAIKRARKAARSKKKADCAEAEERLRHLRAEYHTAKETVKSLRGPAAEAMKAQLAALETERKERVKEARQNSGLYWCNYNAVIASFDTARSRAMKENAGLKFHRYDGSGRLTVQIIGGLPLAGLVTSQSNQLRLFLPESYQRGKNRGTVFMAIYSRDRTPRRYCWPIIMHRPIPEGSIIQEATITRRATGCKWKSAAYEWSISFLLRVPKQEVERTQSGCCGVDVGWRQMADGLRVAVIATRDADGKGKWEPVTLPEPSGVRREKRHAGFLDDERYLRDLRSQISARSTRIVERLRSAGIASMPCGDPEGELARAIAAIVKSDAISKHALTRLADAWGEKRPDWNPDLLKDLRAVNRENTRDWGETAGRRRGISNWRRDIYRKLAVRLARTYAVIGIEAVNWRDLASQGGLPSPAASMRPLASPGELLEEIRKAAAKYGARIVEHTGLSTWTCSRCKTEFVPADKSQLIQTCPHCGSMWDQDANAAFNLLAVAESSAPAADISGTPLEPGKDEKSQSVKETRWARARRKLAEKEDGNGDRSKSA